MLNAVADLGFEASVPESWIRATAGNAAANEYHRRFAERLETR
ncbi:MAG TPA: hypothetical protein PLI18_07485 [Pirellulaceae bacterium]|nr:hypothetical protein [Pirellulaceae bacterium]